MVPHYDPDGLALIALGEPVELGGHVEPGHLHTCTACRADLESLRRTVAVGRATSTADAPVAPPPQVWHAVVRELGLSPDVGRPLHLLRQPPAPSGTGSAVPLIDSARRRPGRRWAALVAAVVAGVLAGSGATWLAAQRDGAAPAGQGSVAARATLEPLPSWQASGEAQLVDEPGGERRLVVTLQAPAPGTRDFREVWLLDADAKRLVSLGVLDGSHGDYVVPAGLDLATYPVVDVSEEPADGNPAHSGKSIVRGRLDV